MFFDLTQPSPARDSLSRRAAASGMPGSSPGASDAGGAPTIRRSGVSSKPSDSDDDVIVIDSPTRDESRSAPAKRSGKEVSFSSPTGVWPKALPSITLSCMSCKGIRGAELYSTPLKVWHEAPAVPIPAKVARGWNRSAAGAPFTRSGQDGELLVAEQSSDLSVRFGFERVRTNGVWGEQQTELIALGRLPKELAIPLSALLANGYVSVTGNVVAAPDMLTVGCDLTLWLSMHVQKPARRLMRYVKQHTAPAPGISTSEAAGVDRFTTSPADMRARAALFEVVHYCVKGVPAPKPKMSQDSKTAAAASRPSETPTSTTPGEKTGEVENDNEGADNVEEHVDAKDVSRIYSVAGTGGGADIRAPALPVADQPVGIRNVCLRPYQRQALAWMLGRELETGPVGEDPASWAAKFAPAPAAGASASGSSDASSSRPSEAAEEAAVNSLVRSAVSGAAGGSNASLAGAMSMWETFAFEDGHPLFVNPYTRQVSIVAPPKAQPCRGGIIGDEMGLGKTCEVVSLIVAQLEARGQRRKSRKATSPSIASARSIQSATATAPTGSGEKRRRDEAIAMDDESPPAAGPRRRGRPRKVAPLPGELADGKEASSASASVPGVSPSDDEMSDDDGPADDFGALPRTHATLVVCPMTMMGQWKREIAKYTLLSNPDVPDDSVLGSGGLRTTIDYGASRARAGSAFRNCDVVITSYGALASQYSTMLKRTPGSPLPPLYAVRWERVVLDEAHTIRNRTTRVARACTDLAAKFRWCLTGTPIQNSLQDLYSLFRFLRHEPWSELLWWKRIISDPYEKRDPRAIHALQAVLRPLLLRRTKAMTDLDGRKIGDLAPAKIEIVRVTLAQEERAFYDAVYRKSKTRFQGFASSGRLLSQYAAILSLLLRLRQACLHPYLVLASGAGSMGAIVPGVSSQKTAAVEEDAEVAAPEDDDAGFSATFLQTLYHQLLAKARARGTSQHDAVPMRRGIADALAASAVAAPASAAVDTHHESFLLTQMETISSMGHQEQECPVCFDPLRKGGSVILTCAHIVCRGCAEKCLKNTRACPVCASPLERGKDDVIALGGARSGPSAAVSSSASWGAHASTRDHSIAKLDRAALRNGDPDVPWVMSSKLSLLLDHLDSIKEHNRRALARQEENARRAKTAPKADDETVDEVPEEEVTATRGMVLEGFTRVVVFSYFTFMLDLVERVLRTAGIGFARLDGTMAQPQREAALASFRSDVSTNVILMSLKAGGLGLNLTEANIVYLLDPWWNPSAEHQALSRVHRLGQTKEVFVKRFIAAETIEESMLEIQARKEKLAATALEGGVGGSSSRLSEEDLMLLFRR